MKVRAFAPPGLPTFAVLALASAMALGLLGLRMSQTGSPGFSFLSWNLLLAWVPVGAAAALYMEHRLKVPRLALLGSFAIWLTFLPNAPYLVTDLKHLHANGGAPLWFDAAMLSLFGGCGLLLAFYSLQVVQGVVTERMGRLCGWAVVVAAVMASAAGVYLGRVLRLNSWDVVRRPGLLLDLVNHRAQDPLGNPNLLWAMLAGTAGMTVGYALWLFAGKFGKHLFAARTPRTSPRWPVST